MARVSDGYYCSGCYKKIPEEHVRKLGHSIGNVHDDGSKTPCMSGKVAPLWREKEEG